MFSVFTPPALHSRSACCPSYLQWCPSIARNLSGCNQSKCSAVGFHGGTQYIYMIAGSPAIGLTRIWLPSGELSRARPRRGDIPRLGGLVWGGGGWRWWSPSLPSLSSSSLHGRALTATGGHYCRGHSTPHYTGPLYWLSTIWKQSGPSQRNIEKCFKPPLSLSVKLTDTLLLKQCNNLPSDNIAKSRPMTNNNFVLSFGEQ